MMDNHKSRFNLLLDKTVHTGLFVCFKSMYHRYHMYYFCVQVKNVHCKPGETVGEGDLLVELE